jgi:hypothetical protein
MRVFSLVSALAAVLVIGCNGSGAQPDHQAEWRNVLEQKKSAVRTDATPRQKQLYADSVRAFVQKHPNHGRAAQLNYVLSNSFGFGGINACVVLGRAN